MNDLYFTVNTRSLPQVSALDSCSHKPPYVHFKRKYHEYILYVLTEGELFLREDEEEYHLTKNDCILLDPTRTHVGIKTSTVSFCYFHFLPGYKDNRYPEVDENHCIGADEMLFPKYHHLESEKAIDMCRELCSKVHELSMDANRLNRAIASSLLHMMMLTIADDIENIRYIENAGAKRRSGTVTELKWYLKQHYMDRFESGIIGEQAGYNYDHLNRLFKADTGDTIYQYLQKIRCEEAKKLLETGYYNNNEIAVRVGLGSSEHFCNVYKKYMGHTPRNRFV